LSSTPSEPILAGGNEEAILFVRGLGILHHWTGDENMHQTPFEVPATFVAYNLFMNSVDRMDQKRQQILQEIRKRKYT
jgi:hypothetical protein